jgi:hypothetical protein
MLTWHEVRSEDHGCGLMSSFARNHPEFWAVNDQGEACIAELSWAIPEVMQRRFALFDEIAAYEPDGICFDFFKGGNTTRRRFDEDGYCATGYEEAMRALFKERTGLDARDLPNNEDAWLRFRAEFPTAYLRRCRETKKDLYPDMEFALFAASPGAACCKGDVMRDGEAAQAVLPNGLANVEDQETWIAEGLIDHFCARHNLSSSGAAVYDGDYERGRRAVLAEVPPQKALVNGRVPLAVQVCIYGQRDTDAEPWAEHVLSAAAEAGAREIVLRESCPIWPNPSFWTTLAEAARRYETVNES